MVHAIGKSNQVDMVLELAQAFKLIPLHLYGVTHPSNYLEVVQV